MPIKSGQTKPCKHCGRPFYAPRHRADIAFYCSRECHGLYRVGKSGGSCKERDDAIARGDTFYFTGLPCPRGHISPRYVSCYRCVECAKADMGAKRLVTVKRKSMRPLTPRQQAKATGATRYWTKVPCPRGHLSERLTVNGACVECSRENAARREAENAENGDRRLLYRKENAEKYRSHTRNRRSKLKAVGTHSERDVDALWNRQRGRCAYCARRLDAGYHVDHIMPLSKGGHNGRSNLQLTCQGCNLRKGSKAPEKFAAELGLLV